MYLGIEIGGTKLQLGLGDDTGTLASLWRGTIDASGAESIRVQIEAALPELFRQANTTATNLRGVGVGFGGPVDDDTQTVIKSHQIEGWDGFPLAEWITKLVGVPAVLGNDADVAGLAEARHGAGRDCDSVFYITLGSGIGGGLILNGRIVRGCGRGAAEIGHLHVPIPDERMWQRPTSTTPVRYGRLEHIASGWALQNRARAAALAHPEEAHTLLDLVGGDAEQIRVPHLRQAAEQGDPIALGVLGYLIDYLCIGISRVVTLLCPRRVVVGGGVSLLGDALLFDPLRRRWRERESGFPFFELAFEPYVDLVEIVPAQLGEEVVVHGAIALSAQPPSPDS